MFKCLLFIKDDDQSNMIGISCFKLIVHGTKPSDD